MVQFPTTAVLCYLGCSELPRKDIPLLVSPNKSSKQPRLRPSPSAAALLPYMQLHYLNFQPKLVAQYEPKLTQLWCLQKTSSLQRGWSQFLQGDKLLLQGKGTHVPSQTSKPNSKELSYFPSVGKVTMLPADYPAMHEANILLSAPTFSVANQGY